ncbi:type II CAAX prenyl endopeptidase Rce1 family protein [Elusimicrobiota bacterium]
MKRALALTLSITLTAGPLARSSQAAVRAAHVGSAAMTLGMPALSLTAGKAPGPLSSTVSGPLSLSSTLPSTVFTGAPTSRISSPQGTAAVIPISAALSAPGYRSAIPASRQAAIRTVSTKVEASAPAIRTTGKRPDVLGALQRAARAPTRAGPGTNASITTRAGALFDGLRSGQRGNLAEPVPRKRTRVLGRLLLSPLRLLKPARPKIKTEFDNDEYGGPPALKPAPNAPESSRFRGLLTTARRQAGYGLKWGLNMLGIAAVLEFVAHPLIKMLPWQLAASDTFLQGAGRIELLTGLGPQAIAQAVASSPVGFLFGTLPQMVLMEEFVYRLLAFGLTFLALAAMRPLARRIASFLDDVPDLFGLRTAAQIVLRAIGGISGKAYALAAGISALMFSTAHLAAWGFFPYTIVFHAAMGLVLAHVAYRSRGLIAPFVAHLSFNLAMISLGALLPLHVLPNTAMILTTLASVAAMAALWYNLRSHRKDRLAQETRSPPPYHGGTGAAAEHLRRPRPDAGPRQFLAARADVAARGHTRAGTGETGRTGPAAV